MVALEKLPQQQTVANMEAKVNILLTKTEKLGSDLREQIADAQFVLRKMNELVEVIQKIDKYIGHPSNIINKVKLFDNHFVNNPVSGVGLRGICFEKLRGV